MKSHFSREEAWAKNWGDWKPLEPFPESLNDCFFRIIFTSPTLEWVSSSLHPVILKLSPFLHISVDVFLLVLIVKIAQVFYKTSQQYGAW